VKLLGPLIAPGSHFLELLIVFDVLSFDSLQLPNAVRRVIGGAVMMYEINEVNDWLVGKPQEKVLMNIAASFPSVKKPRYVDQEKSRQYD
jgi:hypothetical protein